MESKPHLCPLICSHSWLLEVEPQRSFLKWVWQVAEMHAGVSVCWVGSVSRGNAPLSHSLDVFYPPLAPADSCLLTKTKGDLILLYFRF